MSTTYTEDQVKDLLAEEMRKRVKLINEIEELKPQTRSRLHATNKKHAARIICLENDVVLLTAESSRKSEEFNLVSMQLERAREVLVRTRTLAFNLEMLARDAGADPAAIASFHY